VENDPLRSRFSPASTRSPRFAGESGLGEAGEASNLKMNQFDFNFTILHCNFTLWPIRHILRVNPEYHWRIEICILHYL